MPGYRPEFHHRPGQAPGHHPDGGGEDHHPFQPGRRHGHGPGAAGPGERPSPPPHRDQGGLPCCAWRRSRPAVPCRLKVRWGSAPPSPPFLSPRTLTAPRWGTWPARSPCSSRARRSWNCTIHTGGGTPWPAWTRRSCTPGGPGSPGQPGLSSGSGITYRNRKRCYKNRRGCKTMKSLAELQAIRDKMRQQIDLRDSGTTASAWWWV